MAGARSRFITLEGGEGTGKSTQARLLVSALDERGIAAIATREPGGAPGAEEIRQILVTGERGRWDPVSEMLLHFSARREHLARTVWPALSRAEWVVSDRFADSTRAYQGYGLGVDLELIERCYALSVGDFAPDLTIILDLDPQAGVRRAEARAGAENRYEQMDLEFHERVRSGFLKIAKREPNRCAVLSAEGTIQDVHSSIMSVVQSRLGLSDDDRKPTGVAPDRAAVTLREVTAETVRAVCALKPKEEQRSLVASNALSIAQAHFDPTAWFRAIYAEEKPVGFVMIRREPESRVCILWRFMIDGGHQGKGYGRAALSLTIRHVRTIANVDEIVTSYVPVHGCPRGFYAQFGFADTGELLPSGERIMRLTL